MEHYLDFGHAIYAHASSLYGGGDVQGYAQTDAIAFDIEPDSRWPVRSAATIDIRTPRVTLGRACIQAGGLLRYVKAALAGAYRAPSRIRADAHLLTPLTQMVDIEFSSGFGRYKYLNLTSLLPVTPDRSRFIFSAFVYRDEGARPRYLMRRFVDFYLKHSIEIAHIKGEDEKILASTRYREEFFTTPWDKTVTSMRSLFTNYVKEKAHLYPEDSLIHGIRMRPVRGSTDTASGAPDAADTAVPGTLERTA
jgi:hypothetical protein